MMDLKLLAVILAAAVLMAACAQTAAPAQNVTPPPIEPESSAAPAPAPGEDGLAPPAAPPEQSSAPPENEPPAAPPDTPSAQLNQPDGRLLLYRFLPDAGLYEAKKLLDMPQNAGYDDVFFAVAGEVFPGAKLPAVNAVTVQKSYVVCDLSRDWIESFDKRQLYDFCNTLSMTMQQNCHCDSVGFKIDGEFGLMGGERWDTAELKLLESADPAEFAAIRGKIPYMGLVVPGYTGQFDLQMADELKDDAIAREIHRVLTLAGELTVDFDHPSGNDMDYAILHLLWCTPHISTDPQDIGYDAETARTIMPLAASVSQRLGMQERWFWLREHVEESARLIYGDDFEVIHQRPRLPYSWFETEGVYTPPHMDGGWSIAPYLYSYTEEDGVVTAEAAYLYEGMGEVFDAASQSWDDPMQSDEEIAALLQNGAVRRTVTLRREDDGRLTLRSHHFIDSGGN